MEGVASAWFLFALLAASAHSQHVGQMQQCAQAPYGAPTQQCPQPLPPQQAQQLACANCPPLEPRVAYAVTRPSPCNDFPVSYRVQVPAEREKILPVDQVTINLVGGMADIRPSAACFVPR